MSLTISPDARLHDKAAALLPERGLLSTPGLVGMALLVTVMLTMPAINQFMETGFFLDPDDAMRLSQVRDYMNGQGWFDMAASRLDAPHGVFMHWTRIIDVPMALLIRFFGLFTGQEMAERLMRLVLPLVLIAGLFWASICTARLLAGPAGPLAATLLTIFSGAMFAYFAPGRLDHDDFAVLGLVLMTASLMRALDAREHRAPAIAGIIIAFNLSVSLETLPIIVVAVAVLPASWVFAGRAMQHSLTLFALSLAGSLLAAFAMTVAPSRYFLGACDTLSAAHIVAGLCGAALCLALAQATPVLPGIGHRLVVAATAGLATIAAVYFTFPACLADPYANIDPVLRQLWLDEVSEARPLWKAIQLRPVLGPMLVVPMLAGLGGTLWAAWSERGLARMRWIAMGAIVLAGCAAAVWQVRATGVVMPLALFGSVYVVTRLVRHLLAASSALAVPALALAAFAISPMFLGAVAPDSARPDELENAKIQFTCRTQAAFAAIASLPQGIVLAPIDTGAHLLARTPHGVIAAPYHRNEHGNRLALDAFRADPVAAEAIVRDSGARYIVLCPKINDLELYHANAPAGLAATLDDGKVPAWLKPLALDTPYKVFEVR